MSKAVVIKDADFSANKLTTVVFGSAVPCTALALNKNSVSFNEASATETIVATPTPSNTTDTVSWISSNTDVATVADGVVTAQGAGSATITATCGNQTATCSVSVVLDPAFVLVAGYNPQRRSSTGSASTLDKRSGETDSLNVLAANSTDTSVYPIESKDNIDTGSYWFVPIVLPTGATGFTITSEYELKTRILWFDNTSKETVNNKGAFTLDGKTASGGYDQSDYTYSATIEKPSTSGINSFGGCILLRNRAVTIGQDHASDITLTYLYT